MKMRFSRLLLPVIAVLALLGAPTPSPAAVSIGISVGIAPPLIPIYEQPPIPGYGYIWTPGYWAYGPYGYYWVPGTWVMPPTIGFLWTPPWWGWSNGVYLFHGGYWGPHIGFYGGINYGFGYFGTGFEGGYWERGRFFYNRNVNNFGGRRIDTAFDRAPSHRGFENRVSFNGGTGGIAAQPSAQDQAAARDRHLSATGAQNQHFNAARTNRALLSSTNNGQPAITATNRAGHFNNTGTVTGGTPKFQSNVRTPGTTGSGPAGPGGAHGTGPGGPPHVMTQGVQKGGQPKGGPPPKGDGQPKSKGQNPG
jgi:WXXGXW repeat (2 copies)